MGALRRLRAWWIDDDPDDVARARARFERGQAGDDLVLAPRPVRVGTHRPSRSRLCTRRLTSAPRH